MKVLPHDERVDPAAGCGQALDQGARNVERHFEDLDAQQHHRDHGSTWTDA